MAASIPNGPCPHCYVWGRCACVLPVRKRPPMCEAHNPEGYGCTLDEGHDGRHQAGGSFPVRCWS